MALPTTITGISTAVACVGPYISSGGNVYFFGRDGTTATTLQAYKATDPTSSFSSIATNTGFSTAVQAIAGYQVSDVIHLIVADGTGTSVNYKYRTFDMSSDSFVTSETIASALNTQTQAGVTQFGCSIVVRSGGEVVAFFNGQNVASMGKSYAQTYYSRRTGVNTWSAPVQVSAGGTVDYSNPEALLDASDRVQFIFGGANAPGLQYNRRSLSSANSLDTVSTSSPAGGNNVTQGISYDASGTQKIVTTRVSSVVYFDGGAGPTLNITSGFAPVSNFTLPMALFVDTGDSNKVWVLYRKAADSDLYVANSTDHGATWTEIADAFTATVASAADNISKDGAIYQRGSDVVIPYIVNDNGTLKYNEYVVRTVVGTTDGDGSASGAATVVGTSAATKTAAANSNSVATASGASAATKTAAGSSAGVGAVSGGGAATASEVASSAGASTADAAGLATYTGTASATGTATVAATSVATAAEVGSSSGLATVSGVGSATAAETGSSSGLSTISGTGAASAASVANSAGVSTAGAVGSTATQVNASASGASTVSGVSVATAAEIASSIGAGNVSGVSSATAAETAASAGISSVSGVTTANAASIANAAGASTADAAGSTAAQSEGAASASGLATVSGVSAATAAESGASSGVAAVSGIGASTALEIATSAGISTVSGFSASSAAERATSSGVAGVSGVSAATASETASSAGVSTVSGASSSAAASVANSSAISTADAISAGTTVVDAAASADGSSTVSGVSAASATSDAAAVGTSTAGAVGSSTGGGVVTPPTVGGGFVAHRGEPYSRKKLEKILEEILEELHEAEARALELKSKKAKKRLAKTREIIEQAALSGTPDYALARETERRLVQLQAALHGAAVAKENGRLLVQTQMAVAVAAKVMEQLDDDEEALALLLVA